MIYKQHTNTGTGKSKDNKGEQKEGEQAQTSQGEQGKQSQGKAENADDKSMTQKARDELNRLIEITKDFLNQPSEQKEGEEGDVNAKGGKSFRLRQGEVVTDFEKSGATDDDIDVLPGLPRKE